jgi:hypothetical protein
MKPEVQQVKKEDGVMKKRRILMTLFISLIMGGMNLAAAGVYVRITPPAVKRVVVKPKCPFKNGVWVKGHWSWKSKEYAWVPGHWVKPRRGYVWIDGHWKKTPRGWIWTRGHWKKVRR